MYVLVYHFRMYCIGVWYMSDFELGISRSLKVKVISEPGSLTYIEYLLSVSNINICSSV